MPWKQLVDGQESSQAEKVNGTEVIKALEKIRVKKGDPVAIAFAVHGGASTSKNPIAEFQFNGMKQLPGMQLLVSLLIRYSLLQSRANQKDEFFV